MSNVYFDGAIFESTIDFQPAFSKTITYGVDAIGSRTPVRTGNLKNNIDSDSTSIFDDAPYAGFVEGGTVYFEGRFMLENSLGEIEEEFIDNLIDLIS